MQRDLPRMMAVILYVPPSVTPFALVSQGDVVDVEHVKSYIDFDVHNSITYAILMIHFIPSQIQNVFLLIYCSIFF